MRLVSTILAPLRCDTSFAYLFTNLIFISSAYETLSSGLNVLLWSVFLREFKRWFHRLYMGGILSFSWNRLFLRIILLDKLILKTLIVIIIASLRRLGLTWLLYLSLKWWGKENFMCGITYVLRVCLRSMDSWIVFQGYLCFSLGFSLRSNRPSLPLISKLSFLTPESLRSPWPAISLWLYHFIGIFRLSDLSCDS